MKWRSSIKPKLLKKTLIRGTILASGGLVAIFAAWAFFYDTVTSYFGFGLFIIGLALITAGMLPYKQLTQLELFPHLLELNSPTDAQQYELHYFQKGKPYLAIPVTIIKKLNYIDANDHYGIAIELKQTSAAKVRILQNKSPIKFLAMSKKISRADIFLPFFSRYTFEELNTRLDDIVHFN